MYGENELRDIHGTAMDFFLDNGYFPGGRELYLGPECAVIGAGPEDGTSLVVLKAAMYPEDFTEHDPELCLRYAYEVCGRKGLSYQDCEVYFMGAGLIRKDAPEEEKGVFELETTYQVACRDVYRLKRRKGEDHGFRPDDPVQLPSVGDEYTYIQTLSAASGEIDSCERTGLFDGNGRIVDGWEIGVLKPNGLRVVTELYVDPYCLPSDVVVPQVISDLFD